MTGDLMTLKDVATLHHCTERRARDVIVKIKGFPGEAPTSTPAKRLWVRDEVIAFVTRANYSRPTHDSGYALALQ